MESSAHVDPKHGALEVEELKKQYGDDCRVIENIGAFAFVVRITLRQWNCSIKFQITDKYPLVPPEIIVASCGDVAWTVEELQKYIQADSASSTLMTQCLQRALRWLNECGASALSPTHLLTADTQKQPRRKAKGKKACSEEQDTEKKISMKTAEDVIKRIMWDSNLHADDFSVGYLDRFLGVLEKSFGAFSWEDLASVDYTVLAIPKHRIQYFKYKSLKVWDKNERLDNVFGSVGSGITISDVIAMQDENERMEDEEIREQRKAEADGVEARSIPEAAGGTGDETDEDSDDDGVTVTIGTGNNCMDNRDSQDEDEDGIDVHWRNKMRPNYFLCQRITDSSIIEGITSMQNVLLERAPQYESCLIRPSSLHITLCTLGLDTPQLLKECIELLKQSQAELTEMLAGGITIECSGVDHFYNRVIYSKVLFNKNFFDFVDHLRALIREAGLNIRDSYDFVPHMTIMKITRPVVRNTGSKTVPSWMYNNFRDMKFGSQKIERIHLCEMKADKASDGFYVSPAYIDL